MRRPVWLPCLATLALVALLLLPWLPAAAEQERPLTLQSEPGALSPSSSAASTWQCHPSGGPSCFRTLRSVTMVSATEGWAGGLPVLQYTAAGGPRMVTVSSLYVDVAATAGDATASLGRAIQLQGAAEILEGQLPAGTASWSGTVVATPFTAALSLGITSFSPMTLSLSRFQVSLPTGQSVDISYVGNTVLAAPGTTPIAQSVSQHVAGIGDVTFTFVGQAQIGVVIQQ